MKNESKGVELFEEVLCSNMNSSNNNALIILQSWFSTILSYILPEFFNHITPSKNKTRSTGLVTSQFNNANASFSW